LRKLRIARAAAQVQARRHQLGDVIMNKRALALVPVLVLMVACGLQGPKSAAGFRLPDGDEQAGRTAFVQLRCHVCHQVEGVDAKSEGTGGASVRLGGDTLRVKTYGDLVTSIINPSHRIAPGTDPATVAPGGRSLMENAGLNDIMTVRQLIDLVAFLQTTYHVMPAEPYPYGYVYP
jgi:L-cysteine S-thiosulfotransferase